jgi:hypothetical protein
VRGGRGRASGDGDAEARGLIVPKTVIKLRYRAPFLPTALRLETAQVTANEMSCDHRKKFRIANQAIRHLADAVSSARRPIRSCRGQRIVLVRSKGALFLLVPIPVQRSQATGSAARSEVS